MSDRLKEHDLTDDAMAYFFSDGDIVIKDFQGDRILLSAASQHKLLTVLLEQFGYDL